MLDGIQHGYRTTAMPTLKTILVYTLRGERAYALYKRNYRTISGLTEVRAGITFEDGDAFVTWLPVFDDWWQ